MSVAQVVRFEIERRPRLSTPPPDIRRAAPRHAAPSGLAPASCRLLRFLCVCVERCGVPPIYFDECVSEDPNDWVHERLNSADYWPGL
ncbi:hypothetical protein AURDEDRAFT_164533 [Auricularia subglabra TFB-10046 SS5]|nr:hypothetical protein AURDEDRAFT_164533 [Auricularia subglabra TFB-10046 SS5]